MKIDSKLWTALLLGTALTYGLVYALGSQSDRPLNGPSFDGGAVAVMSGSMRLRTASGTHVSVAEDSQQNIGQGSGLALRPAARESANRLEVLSAAGRLGLAEERELRSQFGRAIRSGDLVSLRAWAATEYGVDRERDGLLVAAVHRLGALGQSEDRALAARRGVDFLRTELQLWRAGAGRPGLMVNILDTLGGIPAASLAGVGEDAVAEALVDDTLPRAVRSAAAQALSHIGGARAHAHLAAFRDDLRALLAEALAAGSGGAPSGGETAFLLDTLREVEASIAALH